MLTQTKNTFWSELTDVIGSTIPSAYPEAAGDVRLYENNFYILVKNSSGVTLNRGDVVCWDVTANQTDYRESVYVPIAARINLFAGIVMASASVAHGSHCWIAVDGYVASAKLGRSAEDPAHVAGDLYRIASVASNSVGYLTALGSNISATAYSSLGYGNAVGILLVPLASYTVTDSTVSTVPMMIRFKEI